MTGEMLEAAKLSLDCVQLASKSTREILVYLLTTSDPMDDAEICRVMTALNVPLMVLETLMKHDPRIALMLAVPMAKAIDTLKDHPFQEVIDQIRKDVTAIESAT